MTEPLNHKLDVSKIQTLEDVRNVFDCMNLVYNGTETHEQYELLKEYFTIPYEPQEIKFELPHKSLEEIQQELDEKFEKLIEKTHLEYRIGHNWTYKLRKYEEFCKKQDSDFSYAKEYGYFPQITFLDSSKFTISSKFDISSPSFVIKQSNNHKGYYTIGEDGYYKFYMEKKPNMIFRFFVYKLMGFKWIDEVL